jgi:hypothetical protein
MIEYDELSFAMEWFPELVGLYQNAAGDGDVVVCDEEP